MFDMNNIPEVSLEEEDLLSAAEERTGLSDWGDRNFMEAFRVLRKAVLEEANLNRLGRYSNYYGFVRLLTNQLLFNQEKKQRPPETIENGKQYLFIVGLPRTGTTLLHNLLVQDPSAHYLRLCDGLHPFPAPTPETWNDKTDPRIEKTQKFVDSVNQASSTFPAIHYLDTTGPEECQWLFTHQFMDTFFGIRMNILSYYWWLVEQNHEASYAEYHDMLKVLGRHFTFDRWVLKAPRHLLFLDALLKEFPDACIIWPHRDVRKVVASLCSMVELMRRGYADDVENEMLKLGEYVCFFCRQMLDRADAVRKKADQRLFYDVNYADLIADPAEEIKNIYEYFRLPFTEEMEGNIATWLNEHPKNKHGRHTYGLEQYGLTEEGTKEYFKDYLEQYSIPSE